MGGIIMAVQKISSLKLEECVWGVINTYCQDLVDRLLRPIEVRNLLQEGPQVEASEEEIIDAFFGLCQRGRLTRKIGSDGVGIYFYWPSE